MKAAIAESVRRKARKLLREAGIALTKEESKNIEIADLGFNDINTIGLEVVTYENNDRYCAKELLLLPNQFFPEHKHPATSEKNPGKRETFRCRRGVVYLYVPGAPVKRPKVKVPEAYKPYVTVWHEVVLRPGEQYTLQPNTPHWFQAGKSGAVVSEFSSTSDDATDIFTDPRIKRLPVIE